MQARTRPSFKAPLPGGWANCGELPLGLDLLTLLERFNDQSEVDEGDKHHIQLFESRENALNSFQPPEQPLDLVASLVHFLVVTGRSTALSTTYSWSILLSAILIAAGRYLPAKGGHAPAELRIYRP